jgi:hypothetical protein
MAKKLVKNYVFTAGKGLNDNIVPLAYAKILANRTFLIKEINALIAYRVLNNYSASYTGYVYSVAKCERDTGYVIDALLKDLRYGGNENIWLTSSKYYDGVTPLIAGDRVPEVDAYIYAITLINTYILTNTAVPSPYQNLNTQVINSGTVAEAGVTARVSTLLTNVHTVIANGLGSLPTLDVRLARIEVLGKVSLADLLLITDVSQNVVIYNFSDPSKGGTVEFTAGNSLSYPTATTANNGVTVIRFTFNTEALLSTDIIQIFLESTELRVRPYDFGTDAIERMRVAQPQAMLDADFEYGLQPTKWQAIGMQRGYPATYELPGTDLIVLSVTTDASTGSGGIGQSLMTVTTQSAHGFTIGIPFTIKALNSSVLGFNRSEGTFIVVDVPTPTTFKYYAKAKVGSSNGQTMATTNTQLRQAAFYTGASVGTPTFSVVSNGAAVNITTALQTPLGGNTITFIGTKPSVGAPLTGTGIVTNTQISGVFGDTSANGKLGTYYVKTTQVSNESFIDLTSVTSIVTNMAVSNRDTTPIALEITSIGGSGLSATQINLNSPITTSLRGDVSTYAGGANQQISTGTGCQLNVSKAGGAYTVDSVAVAGSGYAVGDTLQIPGTNLGYSGSGAGTLIVNVATVSTGGVTSVTVISGLSSGTGSYTNVATQTTGGQGYGNTWSVGRAGGVYTVNASSYTNSAQFYVGNRVKINGTNFEGATPANDLTITITSVGAGGVITGTSVSGTAIRGDTVDVYNTFTISAPTTGIVPAGTVITGSAIALLQIDFASAHGFVPGTGLNIVISSTGTNHQLAGGPFFVEQITGASSVRYTARTTGTIDASTAITGTVYVRPDSFFSHRPYDGGVQLGTGGPQHGGHAIRMSKKYIRYQSGKGAMYNTGALFAPAFDIRSITASALAAGSLITVVMDEVDHGCQAGATIRLIGITTAGYNGDYIVDDVIDERSFIVAATTALASTTAVIGSQCQMSLLKWHGSTVRSGPFDDQNGIFFQYDGQNFAVGRRTSTFQIAGNIAINSDSNAVTGTNTRFFDQLQAGDRIVIKGMTHVVATITSQTAMTVTPDFRGVTNITGAKVCKVQDLIINQNDFNLDKIDGTGPSGYTLDITKMQMIGIQFSWYGAGFIDWMIRGPEGNYTFIHRLKGNNLNTEAYMRTGNLPVRYEVLNEGARAKLVGQLSSSATTMTLESVTDFPTAGTLYVDNELISYTGKNPSTKQLTGLTRSANLSNFAAGAIRSYSAGAAAVHDDRQGVILVSGLVSPIISHWGSAYLIDGLFDSDRGYLFTYASTGISISTTKVTAFLIRLAPSVSNATTGDLGERELLNRAQLLLQEISITVDNMATGASAIVIEGVLNPVNYPLNPSNIVWGGLQSLSAGGQPSFSQIAPGGSVSWSTNASVVTTTATTTAQMTATLAVPNNNGYNVGANNDYCYVTATSWEASGATSTSFTTLRAGITVSGAGFPAGTIITQVGTKSNFAGIDYYFLRFSQRHSQALNANNTFTINLGGATGTVQSFAYFTQATWEASGAAAGTVILDSKFPANTRVSSISGLLNFGGTAYYLVSFTQNTNTSIIAGGTVTFSFTQPAYALPGETVFSLQVNPGDQTMLDLSGLKELTTTAIGGRGTFPNGPDTLAINVYKVSGTAVTGNIILRWGEAQA